MTDLIALAERCEAADGPSFVLEQEIARAVFPILAEQGYGPAYTASIDAAMTLVPKGYFWTAGFCGLTCHASVGPDNKHFARDYLESHEPVDVDIPNPSTPALALCAAALRALAAKETD